MIPRFGITGAAIATASALSIYNLLKVLLALKVMKVLVVDKALLPCFIGCVISVVIAHNIFSFSKLYQFFVSACSLTFLTWKFCLSNEDKIMVTLLCKKLRRRKPD